MNLGMPDDKVHTLSLVIDGDFSENEWGQVRRRFAGVECRSIVMPSWKMGK